MKKKLLQIPKFKSIAEEAEFWDVHDSADYEWEEIPDVKVAKNLKSTYKNVLLIKLDEEILTAIEKVAKDKGIDASKAGTQLLRERLTELRVL